MDKKVTKCPIKNPTSADRYIRTIIAIRLSRNEQPGKDCGCHHGVFGGYFSCMEHRLVRRMDFPNSGLLQSAHSIPPSAPLIVSLEAIFLSTFILISQNRMSEQAERRADLDLHIDLLTEYEMTRVLQMLDAIQDKLGIENAEDTELAELEMETKPEEVLAEIERLQQRALRSTRPRPSDSST
jgi:hypothetical protein